MERYSLWDKYNEDKKKQDETESSRYSLWERYKEDQRLENTDTSFVDQKYIDSFINDSNAFLTTAEKDYGGLGWGTASSAYESRNKSWQDLTARADILSAWLYQNRNNLDQEAYSSFSTSLEDIRRGGSSVLDAFKGSVDYFSQWDTEDAYNAWKTEHDRQEAEKQAILGAPDFKQYSEAGANIENPTYAQANGSDNFLGWKNPFIEGAEINNIVTFSRDNIADIEKALAGSENNADLASVLGDYRYQYLEDDEVAIYNYYLGKGDTQKAEEYLASLDDTLNQRWAGVIADRVSGNAFLEGVFAVNAGLDQFATGVGNIDNLIKGTEADPTTVTQYANATIRENIDGFGGGVAYDLLQTTSHMLPSILVGSMTGGLGGAATLGVSAVGNGYAEMRNLGYNEWQSRGYGLLVGASEATLQYALGGISKLGGVTGNAVGNLVSKFDKVIARVAINLGGRMALEGLEEAIQTVLAPAFKAMVTGETFESPEWEEVWYSALLGVLSAGVLDGVPTIASTAINNYQAKQTYGDGANLTKATLIQDPTNTFAQKMQAKVDSGKSLSGDQINRLVELNEQTRNSQNIADIAADLESKGMSADEAMKTAEWLYKATEGETYNRRQRKAYETDDRISDVHRDLFTNEENSVNKRNADYEALYALAQEASGVTTENAPNQAEASAQQAEAVPVTAENAPAKEIPTEGEFKASTDGKTIHNGAEVKIQRIASIDNGEVMVQFDNGEVVNARDVEFGSEDEALIYEAVAEMDVDTANDFIQGFNSMKNAPLANPQSFSDYMVGFNEAKTYGELGIPFEAMSRDGKYSNALVGNQAQIAYNRGRINGVNKAASAKKVASNNADGGQKNSPRKYKGETHVSEIKKSRAYKSLSDTQKAGVAGMTAIYKALGIDIYFFESPTDAKGNRTGKNGYFNPEDNSVHIDLYAGLDGRGLILFTGGHELTHYIRANLPDKFKAFADILFEQYEANGTSVASLIANKRDFLERKGRITPDMTPEEALDLAYEEVVADACEAMLGSEAFAQISEKVKAKDEGLWNAIKKFFTDLVAKIKAAYAELSPDSVEGQKVAEMLETATDLQKMWVEMLVEASEVHGVSMEVTANDAMTGTDVSDITKKPVQKLQERTEYQEFPKEMIKITSSGAERSPMDIKINGKKFVGSASVRVLRNARFAENKFDPKYVTKVNKMLDKMRDYLVKARVKYTYVGLTDVYNAKIIISPTTGQIVLSGLVNNGDYEINFDFTKTCKKRIALQDVIEQLAREKGRVGEDGIQTEVDLSEENIRHINEVLAANGIETACLCCFVDSKRYAMQAHFQEKVCDVWNRLVDEVNAEEDIFKEAPYFDFAESDVETSKIPDEEYDKLYADITRWRNYKFEDAGEGEGAIERKMKAFLINTPNARKKLRLSDFITEAGRTNLHKLYPDIESLAKAKIGTALPKAKIGTALPKAVESFAPYNGEIELLSVSGKEDLATYVKNIAGARSQSFSDFIMAHVYDVLQKTASLTARKLTAHTYTKEISRARLFGMTGEKTNLSVLHEIDPDVDSWNAGFKADGSYFVSDYDAFSKKLCNQIQAIPDAESIALQNDPRYSRDCGRIGVGFSYNHMLKMHNDPDIRQVIGYHTSSLPAAIKPLTNLDKATDYTPVQNTLTFNGFKKPNYDIPDGVPSYATPPQDIQPRFKTTKTGKQSTQRMSKYGKSDATFDIKGKYAELCKTMDSTKAAKETLRQLLQYADDNGLALVTSKYKNGRGDFDLYGDTEKTQNPHLSADHYIEHCISNGLVPMFYEFALNDNYYKDIYDFNVFDRLSYNPETGLHEDTADRKAYAPQVPVHMMNEDGSMAFPEDFWNLVDKYMNDYNYQREDFAKKFPKIMKEVRSIKDSSGKPMISKQNIKNSDRDSEGNTLSEEQVEFFKDSKVRDKKGNLLVVYHGTTSNFNIFKKGDVGFHFGTKGAARGRVGFGKNVIVKEVYLNITNPIVFDEDLGSWDADYRLTRELYDKGILTQAEAESVLFTDDRNFKRTTEASNKKLASILQEKGYDGIEYSNTFETKKATTSYIIFNSNQAKETSNTTPTSNPDIRYSDRDTSAQKPRSAQAQRDAGYMLSESKFYQLYSAHKLTYSNRGGEINSVIEKIKRDGFISSTSNANVLPTSTMRHFYYDRDGKVRFSNVVQATYAPKKGDYILFVPNNYVTKDDIIKNGFKPLDYEIGVVEYDYQPYYEVYKKAYGQASEQTHEGKVLYSDRDSDYMDAVNRGDMETAQKMVDEVAKTAGYTIKAYHGTNAEFTVFDKNRVGNGIDQYGAGFYFASNPDVTAGYGTKRYDTYLSIKKPIPLISRPGGDGRTLYDVRITQAQAYKILTQHPMMYDTENSPLGDFYDKYWEVGPKEWMVRDLAKQYNSIGALDGDVILYRDYPNELHEAIRDVLGYDGVQVYFDTDAMVDERNDYFYVAWFDNQMKSADPVTYDDNGKVIPLSERFKSENNDIRYSLREVSPVEPTTDKWQRTHTTAEVKAMFPDLWDVSADESEVRNPTQISGTVKSYRKVYDFLKKTGFNGTILDASSGLGYGTKAGIEEYGFDVEDIEPYPDKSYSPKYTDYSTLNKQYDAIISNAVLNVIPQDQRDALVVKMGELLKNGGRMFVNVRGDDVKNASSKVAINEDLMEYYISKSGSYQKGFTKTELVAYLQDALGDGFTVTPTAFFGKTSAVVTKKEGQKGFSQKFIDSTLNSFGLKKLDDSVHIQRQVLATLLNEGFFTDSEARRRTDINEESGLIIETNKSGIDETFSFNNFVKLGKFKKIAKLATIRELPNAIKHGHIVADDVTNKYNSADKNKTFAYIEYEANVDGNEVVVRLAIKKSPQKNKFWVHSIYTIENVSDSPASTNDGTEAGHITADNKGIVPQYRNSVKSKFSDRDPDSASNRTLLANALESVAQNDIERNKLAEYKSKIALIESEQAKLAETKAKIKELSFAKGRRDTEAIKKLQFEANQSANRINTYDRQLLNLEATAALKGVLQREKQLAYKKAEREGKEALEKYREKSAKTQRELLTRYQESRKKGIEGRSKTAMRHKIKNVVNELNQYLLNGTKEKHVPIELQKAVAEALDAVNMDTVSAEERIAKKRDEMLKAKTPEAIEKLAKEISTIREMGDRLDEKLSRLKTAYDSIINSDDPLIANSHDDVISNSIDKVVEVIGDTPLRDMNLYQLEAVYDLYKMVLHSIRTANKAFKAAKGEAISTIANGVIAELEGKKRKSPYTTKAAQARSEFAWNNMKPVYAFERIGSANFTKVFNAVRAGEDVWARDMNEAQAFREEQFKKYKYDSWDFKKRYRFTSTSGKRFELSLDQILSLYAFSKRAQAGDHLKYGGFVFDGLTEVKTKNKVGMTVTYQFKDATAYNLSEQTLAEIIDKLTPEQKEFADAMQDYLSTVMGEKGNEVSLELYDIKLFKEKHYFPLKSAPQYLAKAKEQAQGEVKIKNSGFTKETSPKAKNPIVLSSFMDVWAGHVNEMSMYHAFTLPLEDFYRVYNYHTPADEKMSEMSVGSSIENAHGQASVKYIDHLLKDINGGARSDPRETLGKSMMSRFKKASVMASMSVVVQQPTAIVRAMAIVDAKHFFGKPLKKKHKEAWAELKKYAPVAVIKEMGYFDTGMGKGSVEWLKGEKTFMDKVDDATSKLPALADEITWVAIWNAVKRETVHKYKHLAPNSDAFLKVAGERFTEVITKTQVYDSTLSRSANMRSKSAFMNMLTSFMAEPTTSINMLQDAFHKSNKKYIARAMAAVYGSVLLNSALVSIVYAMRDDDEDETFAEKYLSRFTTEMIDGINPVTYIPFVKDIWSAAQGFDVERADMSLITDLFDSIKQLALTINKDTSDMEEDELAEHKKGVRDAVLGITDTISSLTGVPVKNVRRDINGAINFFKTIGRGQETTANSLGDVILNDVKDSIPVWGWLPDESKADKLYDAIIKGDTVYVDRLKSGYKTEESYHSAVKKIVREHLEDGELASYEAERILVANSDLSEEEASSKVQYWEFKMDYPDSELSEEAVAKYYTDVEPYGINMDVYLGYYERKASCKGWDDDGDGRADSGSKKAEVMEVIDSLPITDEQKDALYFLNGWSEKTLWEAPWH